MKQKKEELMLLNNIILIIDPMKILPEDEAEFLRTEKDYDYAWQDIKLRHGISTNTCPIERFRTIDIFKFHTNIIPVTSKDVPDNIPPLQTESGFLVGLEFKDIKKLNPDITEEDDEIFEGAFVAQTFRASIAMDCDSEGEYVSGMFSIPNEKYDPTDEKSHKNICYCVEWSNDYIDPAFKEFDAELEANKNEETGKGDSNDDGNE